MENPTPIQRKHFTLSDLTRSLTIQISKMYSGKYWIVAEISKLNYYPQSGHCYPMLVEKKDGKIVAEMKGMIYKNAYMRINDHFNKVTGKPLADGMQVLFKCEISFHPKHSISLTILDIEPEYTLGEMARMRVEAIQKLKSEGIFEQNKSLYLPMLLQKLAIISVETSKGFIDFKNVLARSAFRHAIKFRLFPAMMQSDAAVGSIIAALTHIKNSEEQFDAVLIIRGGGGETGLDCYDNYRLARQICLFPVPILTGIGHATNLTVSEQVAHKNLITPTALAGWIIENYESFASRLQKVKQRLLNFKNLWFAISNDKLDRAASQMEFLLAKRLQKNRAHIQILGNRFLTGVQEDLKNAGGDIRFRKPAQLKSGVKTFIEKSRSGVESNAAKIAAQVMTQLKEEKTKLGFNEEKLRILNPENTLKRGFSITTINGKSITNADNIPPGTEIETILWKGKIKSISK